MQWNDLSVIPVDRESGLKKDREASSEQTTQLAVGYLGLGSSLVTGEPDPEVLDRLVRLSLSPKNVVRGWRDCALCEKTDLMNDGPMGYVTPYARNDRRPGETGYFLNGKIWLGFGEVHVPGSGVLYVAPTLIVHYIAEHHYRPPEEFLVTLMSLPDSFFPTGEEDEPE